MIKKIGIAITILLICGLAINVGYSQAYLITIENAGFEEGPVLGVGEYTEPIWDDDGNLLEAPVIPGWDIYYTSPLQKDRVWYGTWHVDTDPDGDADYTSGVPQETHVGYLETDPRWDGIIGFSQTLSDTLLADTMYTFGVHVGNTSGRGYVGFPGFRMELLAGDQVLASLEDIDCPEENTFAPYTLSFIASSDHDMLGQALVIRLSNLNGGEGYEIDLDNVWGEANPVPAPEPASMLLLGLGLFGLAGLTGLNKRKK
ncbi:MAG: PEP-CTERM sorting domain-containing protein [bacterium]